MKIGIIGAGGIAEAHLRALERIKDIKLLNIYDVNHEKALNLSSKFKGKASRDLAEVIYNSDGLIIASPNNYHALHSVEVLKNSKHILCEKPMSVSFIEAQRMVDLAKERAVVASLGFNYRYLPVIREIKRLIQEGFFSDIIRISIELKRNSALTRKKYTWRDSEESLLTSGAMGDLGSHLLDIMGYLFKEDFDHNSFKVNIKTYISKKENKKVHVDDHCNVYGRFNNGTYFDLLASKSVSSEESGLFIHIISSKNEFYYTSRDPETYYTKPSYFWIENKLYQKQHLADPEREVKWWADSFYYQLKDWSSQIQGIRDYPQIASFLDGLSVQRTLSHILQQPN